MPVQTVYRKGRKYYRWGKSGKPYRERWKAARQGRAIKARQGKGRA